MIEETAEMNDWLKIPSEVAVSYGLSMEQAKRMILRDFPNTPLARRLREDWDFEETVQATRYRSQDDTGRDDAAEGDSSRSHQA